jgi:hypothetical protein
MGDYISGRQRLGGHFGENGRKSGRKPQIDHLTAGRNFGLKRSESRPMENSLKKKMAKFRKQL